MKRILLSFAVLTSAFATAQITTTKIAADQDLKVYIEYDSTLNFLAENVRGYIGQDLYLPGMQKDRREMGYLHFLNDYKKPESDQKNIYKSNGMYASKYNELAEKYYTVIDVIPHPLSKEKSFLYGSTSYLKLKEKSKGDIIFYQYNAKYENTFPFIVVGFFEKAKREVNGKVFVFKEGVLATTKDITSGAVVRQQTGQKWTTVDLTVEEKYYSLALVIENDAKERCTISHDYIYDKSRLGRVYYESEVIDYTNRFGAENFEIILKGDVRLGMTSEMCRLAWGNPEDINSTTTSNSSSEQWVYNGKYLYLSDGKLTTIQ